MVIYHSLLNKSVSEKCRHYFIGTLAIRLVDWLKRVEEETHEKLEIIESDFDDSVISIIIVINITRTISK